MGKKVNGQKINDAGMDSFAALVAEESLVHERLAQPTRGPHKTYQELCVHFYSFVFMLVKARGAGTLAPRRRKPRVQVEGSCTAAKRSPKKPVFGYVFGGPVPLFQSGRGLFGGGRGRAGVCGQRHKATTGRVIYTEVAATVLA